MTRVCLPFLLLLAACAGPSQDPPPAGPAPRAEAAPPRSLDQLRQDAARALAEQRIYAPAGDNAIEAYLALRDQSPDARDLDLALLELLPYAVIASEQAVARADLEEARRLLALIERVDPAAPSLARLRDGLVRAEARLRDAAAQEAAERAAAASALAQAEADATPEDAAPPATPPAPATTVASPAATAAAASEMPPPAEPRDPLPAPGATATPASPAPAAANPPAPAPVALQLLSAPPPRYPPLALRRRIEGDVTVVFTVRTDGSVDAPRVASAQPAGLFEDAALDAVRRWRFAPVPRPVETRQVLNFRLPGRGGA